jgi:hypothetical protein
MSLTSKTATITIVGGSYADGAPTLTLKLNKPVTLQNTADGTKYTIVLLPQGTAAAPGSSSSGSSSSSSSSGTGSGSAPAVPTTPSG